MIAFRWRRSGTHLALILAQAIIVPAVLSQPETCLIHWQADPLDSHKVSVEVSGLADSALTTLRQADWKIAQWQRLLSVYVQGRDLSSTNISLPCMLGAYRVHEKAVVFEPQFPLVPGVKYRAVFDPNQIPGAMATGARIVTADWQLPAQRSVPTTVVSHVYPSAGVLPENLLKFYVHFSAPMSRGHSYDFVHLQEQNGRNVELPFLELDEELWNPEMTRLTLFIDPGRIKRGVRPLEEVGPALENGKHYALLIDSRWKDGSGQPLKEHFQKRFTVAPPDRQPPNPAQWKVRSPKSKTRQPLMVRFPKPMDHALAQRVIHVLNSSDELVHGQTALRDEERRWTFVPEAAWREGAYRLRIENTIEDLAGNNIGKPFEVDLFDDASERRTNATVVLPFVIR